MKQILLLLLLITATVQSQTTLANKLKITGNVTDNVATKVNVQDANGLVNTIAKADLIDVIEVASAINLPVTGVIGKIYVTIDSGRLYRWNTPVYTEISVGGVTSVSGLNGVTVSNPTTTPIIGLGNITPTTVATGSVTYTPTTAPSYAEGKAFYDSTAKTLVVYDDISGTASNVTQELNLRARNSTGVTIPNGSVVYISGATGQNPTIALARANLLATSVTIGVATHDILNNTIGKITTFGIVNDLNTSAFTDGQVLYLSPTTAGLLTSTAPTSPNYTAYVCVVLHAHNNQGRIFVRPEQPIALNVALTDNNNTSPSVTAVKSYVDTGLALKANLASPTFTGTPLAPTATAGTNTTQIATTAFAANLDANNVKLTGVQTITGAKTFTNNSIGSGITSNNNSTGTGIFSNNTSTGFGVGSINSYAGNGFHSINSATGNGIYSVNNSNGVSIFSDNNAGGYGIFSNNNSSGVGIVSNTTSTGTGFNYAGQNDGATNFTVNKFGATTATSFINSTAPATNALLANGTTVALGSNAYNSTSYLPLSGGTLTGTLNGTTGNFSSSVSAKEIISNNISGGAGAIQIKGSQSSVINYEIANVIEGLSNSGLQIVDRNSNTKILYFNSTGQANFSSSVTANGQLIIQNQNSDTQSVFGNGIRDIKIDGKTASSQNTLLSMSAISGGNQVGIYDNKVTIAASGAATFSSSVTATDYRISSLNTAPASATATGTTGEIRITAGFIYVCTATNTWVRTALATW